MAQGCIETIEFSDTDSPVGQSEKPLMQLFERLIGNDNKQNTILTNAQIVDILQMEFDMDMLDLHELEVDIYLSVMKKFLKDWPQWDELDTIIKRELGKQRVIKDILNEKYISLKQYLKVVLETSKPMAKEAVTNAINQTAGKVKKSNIDTSNLVMEVQCNRSQLNQLFYRYPHPDLKNTIFHTSEGGPSKIVVSTLPLEAILNWSEVTLNVNFKGFNYMRVVQYKLNHVLINKKLQQEKLTSNELDLDLEIKESDPKKNSRLHRKSDVINYLNELSNLTDSRYTPSSTINVFKTIINLIKTDLMNHASKIRIPGIYRKFANRYKYVRYLYKDLPINTASRRYDLQLQETLTPAFTYIINKFDPTLLEYPVNSNWLTIKCSLCAEKFSTNSIEIMKHHFMSHQGEPDWTCTNCEKQFPVAILAAQHWYHKCD